MYLKEISANGTEFHRLHRFYLFSLLNSFSWDVLTGRVLVCSGSPKFLSTRMLRKTVFWFGTVLIDIYTVLVSQIFRPSLQHLLDFKILLQWLRLLLCEILKNNNCDLILCKIIDRKKIFELYLSLPYCFSSWLY